MSWLSFVPSNLFISTETRSPIFQRSQSKTNHIFGIGRGLGLGSDAILLSTHAGNSLADGRMNRRIQIRESLLANLTRPDTRQSSRGWLGRSNNAKTARNSKMWHTDVPMYRPIRQGGVACPRLKTSYCATDRCLLVKRQRWDLDCLTFSKKTSTQTWSGQGWFNTPIFYHQDGISWRQLQYNITMQSFKLLLPRWTQMVSVKET